MYVNYIGIKKDFNESEISEITRIVDENCKKLERKFPNATLVIQGKKHDKEGTRCKYSFHFRIDNPDLDITAESADWELPRTLHDGMQKVAKALEKKYKFEGNPQERVRNKSKRTDK